MRGQGRILTKNVASNRPFFRLKMKNFFLFQSRHATRRASLCDTQFVHYVSCQKRFCEALFEVEADYKYTDFRHAILSADNVATLQRRMGTVRGIVFGKGQKLHSTLYSAAIERAQELGEYAECWRLYHCAKHDGKVDIYLLTQMINITSKFVETRFLFDVDRRNSKMYRKSKSALEVAKHKMLCRVHRLYGEMRHELQLEPTAATFASLITACSKLKSFVGADRYWELYCSEVGEERPRHEDVYWAIIYSKVAKSDMASAMRLFEEMTTVHHIVPDGRMISKLLSGFARLITTRSRWSVGRVSDFVAESESLICLYFEICAVHDRPPEIEVFNGICNVYASTGDITSCFDILHCLLDGTLPSHLLSAADCSLLAAPSPNTFTFNAALKSLVYCSDLRNGEKQNVWRVVDFVLTKMKEMGADRDCTTYSTLFHLCGNSNVVNIKPDLDRAVAYFAELSNAVPPIEISKKCMHSLLLTGLQYYDYNDHADGDNEGKTQKANLQKLEFIEWWMAEAKEYRIPSTLSIQQLHDIKAHKLRLPK